LAEVEAPAVAEPGARAAWALSADLASVSGSVQVQVRARAPVKDQEWARVSDWASVLATARVLGPAAKQVTRLFLTGPWG
jgi:hypothetical protein